MAEDSWGNHARRSYSCPAILYQNSRDNDSSCHSPLVDAEKLFSSARGLLHVCGAAHHAPRRGEACPQKQKTEENTERPSRRQCLHVHTHHACLPRVSPTAPPAPAGRTRVRGPESLRLGRCLLRLCMLAALRGTLWMHVLQVGIAVYARRGRSARGVRARRPR